MIGAPIGEGRVLEREGRGRRKRRAREKVRGGKGREARRGEKGGEEEEKRIPTRSKPYILYCVAYKHI